MNRLRALWRAIVGTCHSCAAKDEIISHLHGEVDSLRSQVNAVVTLTGARVPGPPPSRPAPPPEPPKPKPRPRAIRVPWSQMLLAGGHVNQRAVQRRAEYEVQQQEQEAGLGATPAGYDEGNP